MDNFINLNFITNNHPLPTSCRIVIKANQEAKENLLAQNQGIKQLLISDNKKNLRAHSIDEKLIKLRKEILAKASFAKLIDSKAQLVW